MRRGVNGTDVLETINAAATAISSDENRFPQASIQMQKRRWGSCWSLYWCFGSHKNNKRIGHAVLVPQTPATGADAPRDENLTQRPSIVVPFIAPPSSPASFFLSEPPSATQSPTGLLSLTSISASMYSPSGPASIFAIGPYAHETQLVSPPVFSTITTEPSTAPFTPPPESVHFTRPSSPEVPFARLLEPNLQNRQAGERYPVSHYEFQSYQLQPGSPVSHLISPRSGISGSGTSSPFLDREFARGHPFFLQFGTGDPSKLFNLDKLVICEGESHEGSGTSTPDAVVPRSRDSFLLNRQDLDVAPLPDICNGLRNDEKEVDHRVSFEITAEEVIRCVEKKPAALHKATVESVENEECTGEKNPIEIPNVHESFTGEMSNTTSAKAHTDGDDEQEQHKKSRTITLGSAKEFNFDNIDGGNSIKHNIGSDWWANEKILKDGGGPCKKWSFPMVQTGAS
ncbi:hydroxyproline-rich glycoprotein family protein [Forsythia ovata]|uniref:Hydroxyproline-rich glycoprotein family protein n=1 Tax=Forsythia ovata TaxID=205694 RepID=A0ABD1W421_9LAMI